MKIEIILNEFSCPFPDLIDGEKYDVVKTEREGMWVILKKDQPLIYPTIKYNPNGTRTPDLI